MITVFSATHGTVLMGAISKIIKQELYTTRTMASSAISKWITQSFIGGQPWEWSIENERYECTIDGELNVMVVEERTVLDALPEEPTLDLWLWNTPITFQPYSDCAHENCLECHGTGTKKFGGGPCVHWLVCHCKKCSPSWGTGDYVVTSQFTLNTSNSKP